MTLDALATDEILLILKGAFLVLLYLFILFVARSATKDLRGAPQESIVLGAAEAASLRAQLPARSASFVVLEGPGLRTGSTITLTTPTVVGRDAASGIRLDGTVAIVTGAARGLGRAMADGLVRAGANVIYADIDGAPEAAQAIDGQTGCGKAAGVACDITDKDACEQLVA